MMDVDGVAQRTIVIIGFEGNTALDLIAAADTFHAANVVAAGNPYRIVTASADGSSFRSEIGLHVVPDCGLDDVAEIDTLIVPGGEGLRIPEVANPIISWIRSNHERIRRIASVCTGLFALAATGLLDGRRAATHWRFADAVRSLHPAIDVDSDAIFVRDGKFSSSAGVTAGIDLALALIEEDLGPAIALAVARELVVFVKRPGGQQQFSEPLRFQTASTPRLRAVGDYVRGHLDGDLSVERLAAQANLSVRQFSRLFRQILGISPGEFVEQARLAEAARRLTEASIPVDGVARSVGYRSADVFARAFSRRFGVNPSHYRDRFSRRSEEFATAP